MSRLTLMVLRLRGAVLHASPVRLCLDEGKRGEKVTSVTVALFVYCGKYCPTMT